MDDLVLNLVEAGPSSRPAGNAKKGGRWTDRVKAKQSVKRKARAPESTIETPQADAAPPIKKRKTDGSKQTSTPTPSAPNRPPTQFISSLFSRNPTIAAATASHAVTPSKPSNAPLDTSSFSGLGLDPLLTAHLSTRLSITRPTSIQRAALPALLTAPSDSSNPRDAFIQAQTGSGKTLSFLLPIIQDLLPLSQLSWIDRSIGTLAIIIAPTRELAKQISDVLEALLQLRLRGAEESAESAGTGERRTRWLVSGLLSGGATRAHEKARLRKGLPILVATPGRLLDHLQNTASFDAGKVRWLVLDEADRLMELGFEESIKGIVKALDGRKKLAVQAVTEGVSTDVGGWDWGVGRRTVLCSATIREDVKKLAGFALRDPVMIKATAVSSEADTPLSTLVGSGGQGDEKNKFTPPAQLAQKCVVVPLKLRLVTLVALLRTLLAQHNSKGAGTRVIVFFSCTDSVDFHFRLLGGASMSAEVASDSVASKSTKTDADGPPDSDSDAEDEDDEEEEKVDRLEDAVLASSELLPGASIYRLHGSLALSQRQAAVKGFTGTKSKSTPTPSGPAILLCTSVASRGLDLPLVRAVVQYDLPTEGGATEYVHRVGRTARAGKGGEAWAFVGPSEGEWVGWVEGRMQGDDIEGVKSKKEEKESVKIQRVDLDGVLREGFGGRGVEFEERATAVQLSFERWALLHKQHTELARKAYLSHIRAYATHPSDEKHMFHVKHLHLGHLAKAFALREAPSAVTKHSSSTSSSSSKHPSSRARESARSNAFGGKALARKAGAGKSRAGKNAGREHDWQETYDPATEARMNKAVREQGKLSKRKGVLVSAGTADYQIASGYDLEKLVGGQA